jgi:hypothetical protein
VCLFTLIVVLVFNMHHFARHHSSLSSSTVVVLSMFCLPKSDTFRIQNCNEPKSFHCRRIEALKYDKLTVTYLNKWLL